MECEWFKEILKDFLERDADILCLQEIKLQEDRHDFYPEDITLL